MVLTSSVAAISAGFDAGHGEDYIYTESDWTDPSKKDLMPYLKSKVSSQKERKWPFCGDERRL